MKAGGLLLLLLALQASAGDRWSTVLVHGFTGWGRGEMGGYNYWGGRDDLAGFLTERGFPTYVAAVGPLSSNWDRACELYAEIKGGRVDYGAAHSQRHGHQRFGRLHDGLLPDWGEPGVHRKLHLIGHSQGGQTVRVLTALLARGDAAERAASGSATHPLFQGGRAWIHSVTSLAAPHDGTTLAMILQRDAGLLLNWVLALASQLGAGSTDTAYDFKLDQWGISQRGDETDEDYRARLADSDVWLREDVALFDLRPEGAALLNRRFPAVPSVYYFSWAARDTVPGPRGRGYRPAAGMNLALLPVSLAISEFTADSPGQGLPAFAEAWWPNDGVVNTVSMSGPKLGDGDRIIHYSPNVDRPLLPGVWHFMGVLDGWDHLDVIGLQTSQDYLTFYRDWLQQLTDLPR